MDATPKPTETKQRDQSSIQFPYGDLDDAVEVARAIMRCGGVPCEADQLAGAMNQMPSSGNFRLKIATARMFGIIETVQNKYQLTDLGFAILDKNREAAAKAEAFLRVPLYRKVYDTFRNKQLPPRPLPLEHAFVGFGVASKQKDRARQAFDRSAQQAGYFDAAGRDRLIRPTAASLDGVPDESQEPIATEQLPQAVRLAGGGGSSSGVGGRSDLPPFIQGLLDSLPKQDSVWKVEDRANWLGAAVKIFSLMYKGGDGDITITVTSDKNKATG